MFPRHLRFGLGAVRALRRTPVAVDGQARVEAGEGTLGGLMQDPTVYENLVAFFEGAKRSLLLRALIRAAIRQGDGER